MTDKKDPEELFIENGELNRGKFMGALYRWVEDMDDGVGEVRCKPDSNEFSVCFDKFSNWINSRVKDWYDFYQEYELKDEMLETLGIFYEDNESFKNILDDNFIYVEGGGIELAEGIGTLEEVKETVEDTVTSAYPELNDVGIVKDNGTPDIGKLKGSILVFVKKVDVIESPKEEPDPKSLRQSWATYMLDRFESEWPNFYMAVVEIDDVEQWIKQFQGEYGWFWETVENKWEHNPELLEGNSDEKRSWKKKVEKQNLKNYNSAEESEFIEEPEIDNIDVTPDLDLEINGNDMIHGDSVEVIEYIAEEYGRIIDAIITDVPYGQGYQGGRGEDFEMISNDESVRAAMRVNRNVFKKSRLALTKGSIVLTTCGFDALFEMTELIDEWYGLCRPAIWDKDYIGMSQSEVEYRPNHEYILYGVYGKPRMENEHRHDGSVVTFKRPGSDNRHHPTEKPVSLMKYLIESFTEEGDLVFDPFAGSGSTLVAAQQLGREYIGVELEEQFYETCKQRLNQQSITAF